MSIHASNDEREGRATAFTNAIRVPTLSVPRARGRREGERGLAAPMCSALFVILLAGFTRLQGRLQLHRVV